eukprot:361257_1
MVQKKQFQIWCFNEKNIQFRLKYLTSTVCKWLSECTPNINEKAKESIMLLNDYMRAMHFSNWKKIVSMNPNVIKFDLCLQQICEYYSSMIQTIMEKARCDNHPGWP